MKVLVPDGDQKSSLAIVRSLARHGISVNVIRSTQVCLVCQSKYAQNPPRSSDNEFLIFPTTDISMHEAFEGINHNHRSTMPFGSFDAYKFLSNKKKLFINARHLGLNIPKTFYSSQIDSVADLNRIFTELGGQFVLKPIQSRIKVNGEWQGFSVEYVHNRQQLKFLFEKISGSPIEYMLQERVQGPGIGVFLLSKKGQTLASFAHKRIREKPPSGGVSVVCESIVPPREALDAAKLIFKDAGWTGVGMVEFKMDARDRRPKLMEVNARFWGSLQLAIASGVDFPYLLYKMARDEDCSGPDSYTLGLRSRWELGDLDHLLIRLKNNSKSLSLPAGAPSKAQAVFRFCSDFFRPSVQNEIFRWDDPKPFLYELKKYIQNIRA